MVFVKGKQGVSTAAVELPGTEGIGLTVCEKSKSKKMKDKCQTKKVTANNYTVVATYAGSDTAEASSTKTKLKVMAPKSKKRPVVTQRPNAWI